ncbi:hypothetical protein ACFQH6_14540 [Halobacteriaceae archaeon GCM10025711]
MSGSDERDDDLSVRRFVAALASLKDRGAALLVVGAVPDRVHDRASRRLLGDRTQVRRRLLVATDADPGYAIDHFGGAGRGDLRVVRHRTGSRSSAVGAHLAPESAAVDVTTTDDLTSLGTAVLDAVREFDRAADGLDAAELRVGVNSLAPLLDHDDLVLFRFLHLLTGVVRNADGLVHVTLPVARDARVVRLLEPLFDGLVELRVTDEGPEQRWDLWQPDHPSAWLPV